MFLECSADIDKDVVSSRNRSDEIIKHLQLADNTSLDPDEKFSKVRPLLDKVNEQCLSNYLLEQRVSIHESVVPYCGRYGCKQFMKKTSL